MATTPDWKKKYINYPEPKCGPDVPYKNNRKDNPAVRGWSILISALLLESFAWLRKIIWRNTGFADLRLIRPHIENYEPRYDPTVVPVSDPSIAAKDSDLLVTEKPKASVSKKYYSASDYRELYISGELTPTAVAHAILPLIRRDTSPPGEHSMAWFASRVDLILAAAEASTLRYKEKRPLGPLDGVPTAVKDEYDVDGYTTCLGSVNDYTAEVVSGKSITSWCAQKLEEAGAINLGKLSMHEFGLDTSGNNPIYGTPTNPYNSQYYTGGSSSGCAYAISAGLVPFALGSDGGGSIRIPSSFCSVFGLKPTHNRLSCRPGMNHSNTCAVNGPLACDIPSLAAAYHVLSAPDASSPFPLITSLNLNPSPDRSKVLGIPEEWFARATPAIQRLCRSTLDRLVSVHGYTLVPITIPFLAEGQLSHAMTVLTDAATLLPVTKNLTAANRIMIAIGTVTPSTDYLLAQKLRALLMQHLAYLWQQHPGMIIMTPTTACAGWHIAQKVDLKYGISDGNQTLKTMEYVWMANFLGLPGISVPAGFVKPAGVAGAGDEAPEEFEGKIPVGLMGVAEWACEEQLLQFGVDAEDVGEEKRCRPPIWVDVIARAKEEMKKSTSGGGDLDTLGANSEAELIH